MLSTIDPGDAAAELAKWDEIIARAELGEHAEDKLVRTAALLTAAVQRSRLQGAQEQLNELSARLTYVHDLLDHL